MLIDTANQELVRKTVEQYQSLVDLEKTTGTITSKTRNRLLQGLQSAELVAVSVELSNRGLTGGSK